MNIEGAVRGHVVSVGAGTGLNMGPGLKRVTFD